MNLIGQTAGLKVRKYPRSFP